MYDDTPRHPTTKEAYGYLALKSSQAGMKLFRLRPKIHFHQHLVLIMSLGSASLSALRALPMLQQHFALGACRLDLNILDLPLTYKILVVM